MDDAFYMKRALAIAKRGTGFTSPNPLVGTVIVKNGRIIGEGYHQRYGDKHAEVAAIESASESVEGAILYCNLEPCSHNIPEKKTPPCTQRIIKEKIGRVVIANKDPNPYVNGNGISLLREHGIEVEVGILEEEAATLNEKFYKFIQTGNPFVHLKIAQSLDGQIATCTGKSRWITNENVLQKVHQLRAEYDAVLVGAGTVRQDNPSLTVRMVEGRNPYRIVLDSRMSIPDRSNLISNGFQHKTIIFTTQSPEHSRIKELRQREIQVISVEADAGNRVSLPAVLHRLSELKIASVLVEGGQKIFTSFIREALFDKVTFFIAPVIIGAGISSVGDLNISNLSQAIRLQHIRIEVIDRQVVVEGYRSIQEIVKKKAEHVECLPG